MNGSKVRVSAGPCEWKVKVGSVGVGGEWKVKVG